MAKGKRGKAQEAPEAFQDAPAISRNWKPGEDAIGTAAGKLEGVYVRRRISGGGNGMPPQPGYVIHTKDGEFTAWGRQDLQDRMEAIPVGSFVRLKVVDKKQRKFFYAVQYRKATKTELAGVNVGETETETDRC